MSLVDTVAVAVHLAFAAVWVGGVVFFTVAVLPLARSGSLNAGPVAAILDRTTTVSRISSVVMLLTGGHLAAAYSGLEFSGIGTSARWTFVLVMIALWFVLAALVEIGASRMQDGLEQKKVRAPARNHRAFFLAASVVGVLLFLDAAVLSTGTYATLL